MTSNNETAGAAPEAPETTLPPAGSIWNPVTEAWEPPPGPAVAVASGDAPPASMLVAHKAPTTPTTPAEDAPEAATEADDPVLAYLKSAEFGKALKNGARAGIIQEATEGGAVGQLFALMFGKGGAFDRWFWTSDIVNQRIKDATYTVLKENGIIKDSAGPAR
jgi:hypothetical protein